MAGVFSLWGLLVFQQKGFPKTHSNSSTDYLLSGFKTNPLEDPTKVRGENWLALYDLPARQESRIRVFPDVHSALPLPNHTQILVIPKFQDTCCIVDVREKVEIARFLARPGMVFSGHGVFSADGKNCFLSEFDTDNRGWISVRDKSFQIITVMPSQSLQPHEIRLLNQGKLLAVANGLGKSTISVLSLSDGRLLEEFVSPSSDQKLRHLVFDSKGFFAAGGWYVGEPNILWEPARIYTGKRGREKLNPYILPNELESIRPKPAQILSLALNEKESIVGATAPAANLSVFFRISDGKLLRAFHFEKPAGIVWDPMSRAFIINTANGNLKFIEENEVKPITRLNCKGTFLRGSHLFKTCLPDPISSGGKQASVSTACS